MTREMSSEGKNSGSESESVVQSPALLSGLLAISNDAISLSREPLLFES